MKIFHAEENAKWKYFENFIFASYDDMNIIKSLHVNIIIVKKDILCLLFLTPFSTKSYFKIISLIPLR
jgi:hypothetical protein